MHNSVKVIAITGPTATGKTALAVKLARLYAGEVVSVDSRQVYRGMDLGTGKDLAEYGEIPVHLVDIAEPDADYNLSNFVRDAFRAIGEIAARGRLPILCGGSAMYLDALLKGYRLPGGELAHESGAPHLRQDRDAADSFAPPFDLDALVLGVYYPRETVRERIEQRLDARFAAGMVDEVQRLHEKRHVSFEKLEYFGLEYREIARYLQGKCDFETMRTLLLNKIRQFAKRQDIFFRKMEREGIVIHWLDGGSTPPAEPLIDGFLAGAPLPPPQKRMIDIRYERKTTVKKR